MKQGTQTPQSRVIKFWSEGKIAESAYRRLNVLRDADRDDDAKELLNEWII